jgi:hypothetical protein
MPTRAWFSTRFLTLGFCTLILAGCSSGTGMAPAGAAPDPGTTQLEVVNRSSSDMDIYIVRSGQQVRLGLAPGNVTTRFVLTPGQVAGVGLVHFQARPITGLGRPIGSEPVMLRLGDVVTLNIPPP